MLLLPKAGNTNGLVACVFLITMQAFALSPIYIQINNKTIIEFGSRRIWGIIKASVCVICLSLNNSSYPTRPHSIIVIVILMYYTNI